MGYWERGRETAFGVPNSFRFQVPMSPWRGPTVFLHFDSTSYLCISIMTHTSAFVSPELQSPASGILLLAAAASD